MKTIDSETIASLMGGCLERAIVPGQLELFGPHDPNITKLIARKIPHPREEETRAYATRDSWERRVYDKRYPILRASVAPFEEQIKTHPNVGRNAESLAWGLLTETMRTGIEHHAALDNADGVPVSRIIAGVKGWVPLGHHFARMNPDRGYTFIHAHPSGASFSDQDLLTFFAIPQVTRMVISGSLGHLYIAEKYARRMAPPDDEIINKYNTDVHRLMPQFDPAPGVPLHRRSEAKDREAWQRQSHVVVGLLANHFGFSYRMEHHPEKAWHG